MTPNIHTILLEVMEQQTISIAKAGIICQLNSRTSILAAANPIKSKYDPKKTVIENINMPPALLSRFDLIYIMLDIPNMEEDKKIASYILDIYTKNPVKTKRYPSCLTQKRKVQHGTADQFHHLRQDSQACHRGLSCNEVKRRVPSVEKSRAKLQYHLSHPSST